MKHANLLTTPMDVKAFLASALDEDDNDNTTDWREKARQLRLRRWRKINEQSQAVSNAFLSSRPYRRVKAHLQTDHYGIAARNY